MKTLVTIAGGLMLAGTLGLGSPADAGIKEWFGKAVNKIKGVGKGLVGKAKSFGRKLRKRGGALLGRLRSTGGRALGRLRGRGGKRLGSRRRGAARGRRIGRRERLLRLRRKRRLLGMRGRSRRPGSTRRRALSRRISRRRPGGALSRRLRGRRMAGSRAMPVRRRTRVASAGSSIGAGAMGARPAPGTDPVAADSWSEGGPVDSTAPAPAAEPPAPAPAAEPSAPAPAAEPPAPAPAAEPSAPAPAAEPPQEGTETGETEIQQAPAAGGEDTAGTATTSSASFAAPAQNLSLGVPGGKNNQRFCNKGTHPGIDVSHSNARGGGPEDTRRGLAVYASLKPSIAIADLNRGPIRDKAGCKNRGLGIRGTGDAVLRDCIVDVDKWGGNRTGYAYGGLVGLACRYGYQKSGGGEGEFTLYMEFLHLITDKYLPKRGNGRVITKAEWAGKPRGLGPLIEKRAVLTAQQLTGSSPPLIGYLGATQWPHVHIQVGYGKAQRYHMHPRIDPVLMLR